MAMDGMNLNNGNVLTEALPQRTIAVGPHWKPSQAIAPSAVLPLNRRQASGQLVNAANGPD